MKAYENFLKEIDLGQMYLLKKNYIDMQPLCSTLVHCFSTELQSAVWYLSPCSNIYCLKICVSVNSKTDKVLLWLYKPKSLAIIHVTFR